GGTARVPWVAAAEFFRGRDRHDQLAVVVARARGDARDEMRIDFRLPEELSVLRVDGVDVRVAVADKRGILRVAVAFHGSYGDCVANNRSHFERPVDTSGLGVYRVHVAVVASDEDTACGVRRRRVLRYSE